MDLDVRNVCIPQARLGLITPNQGPTGWYIQNWMVRSFSEGIQTKTNKHANGGSSPPRFLTFRCPCERCNYCTMKILKDKRGICILHQCLNEAYFIVPNICSMKINIVDTMDHVNSMDPVDFLDIVDVMDLLELHG